MLKKMRLLLLIAIVMTVLLGGIGSEPAPVSADGGDGCTQTHVVAYGQNLFRIGLMYGVRWDVLQHWNGLPNPNLIYVGQVLCVSGPASSNLWTPPPAVPPASPPPAVGPMTLHPGNPFVPTWQPRIYFPEITLGQDFQLSGYNFPANTEVTLSMGILNYYPYTPYYTATTDANGSFLVSVAVPDSLKGSPTVAVHATSWGG